MLQRDAVVNAVASAITKPIYDLGFDQTALALSDEYREALVMDPRRILLAKAQYTGKARIVHEMCNLRISLGCKYQTVGLQ